MTEIERALAEQVRYYRDRAGEYEDWWFRRGRYDHGAAANAAWFAEAAQVQADLERFAPAGQVLELACGTGLWTERLAERAAGVTALDASPEALRIAAAKTRAENVEFVEADLFTWEPVGTYDVCFFSFWLSHVPRSRFSGFWSLVRSCLAPGGRVFLVDNRDDPHPPSEIKDSYVVQSGPDLELRRLHDGSKYQVVEVFYEPKELQSLLGHQDFTARLDATPWFIFGEAACR